MTLDLESADESRVTVCGAERAPDVHRLTQLAFAPQRDLEPPSGAVAETVDRVADDLSDGGGAIAELHGVAIGCLRLVVAEYRHDGYDHTTWLGLRKPITGS